LRPHTYLPLFPYTTLFRSALRDVHLARVEIESHETRHALELDQEEPELTAPAADVENVAERSERRHLLGDGIRPQLDRDVPAIRDRKSTRLNSSHVKNSYA